MKISSNGLTLLKKFEGLRLEAYKVSPADKKFTIGYGHCGSDVYAGMVITEEQATKYLQEDVENAEKFVNNYAEQTGMNQNEFDALVSFTYNCGCGNLAKLMRRGWRAGVESGFKLFTKSNGLTLAGLVTRRQCELDLFNSTNGIEKNVSYYPTFNSENIDMVLSAIGADSDYNKNAEKQYLKREPIANANGIANYVGSAEQNNTLKMLAKNGTLKRP